MKLGKDVQAHNDALLAWFPWLDDKAKADLLKKRGGVLGGICGNRACPVCGKMRLVVKK